MQGDVTSLKKQLIKKKMKTEALREERDRLSQVRKFCPCISAIAFILRH